MPFLTVITRHIPRRNEMMSLNIASLANQSDPDYQHLIIVDEQERGVAWANGMMAKRDWSDVEGDYVMILDDDDCLHEEAIELLKEAAENTPDLIIVRMDHGDRGVLPPAGEFPVRGLIGCSAVIPRRDVFLMAVKSYTANYDGDYDYARACWDVATNVSIKDWIISEVQQIGALTGE